MRFIIKNIIFHNNVAVINGSNYETWVKTKNSVGWVVVDQSVYLPLAGGTMTSVIKLNNDNSSH